MVAVPVSNPFPKRGNRRDSEMEKRTLGIGLSIVQEVVGADHGTLRIESAGTDRGTTVVVELPRGA